ncbi:MAG: hypothetical protein HQK51_17260, partial [Oligoflexia bacterium]|nr:hypothetical protein [Oligoflexia bacterium]
IKGLKRIDIDLELISSLLEQNPALLSEAIQTKLKAILYNEDAYEITKQFFRGKQINKDNYLEFVDSLNIDNETKKMFKNLEVKNYIGIAPSLVDMVINEIDNYFLSNPN